MSVRREKIDDAAELAKRKSAIEQAANIIAARIFELGCYTHDNRKLDIERIITSELNK